MLMQSRDIRESAVIMTGYNKDNLYVSEMRIYIGGIANFTLRPNKD